MKIYKFEVVIYEGNDEFWEEIAERSGCDEVQQRLVDALAEVGYDGANTSIKLVEYTNKE